MTKKQQIIARLKDKTAVVGVVGIGYVGASVVSGSSSAKYETIGFDIDEKRVTAFSLNRTDGARATTDMTQLSHCDVICICVPTPLLPDRSPDYRFLISAAETVSAHMRPGQLVILESSVAPGTTRGLLVPILSRSGLHIGEDVFVGYSPERIDPGNETHTIHTIPKVVSGLDADALELTGVFYGQFVDQIVPVSSPETAELTKILENLFRLVNISLVNELAEYTHATGINVWEVIDAAATKPFGFLAHYPSAGAGGYCIPVLPKFLLEDAQKKHISLPLVQTALEVNESRPQKVAEKIATLLNGKKEQKTPKALLIGISYKAGNHDTRESTALQVWDEMKKIGIEVSYHDPLVPSYQGVTSVALSPQTIQDHDVIVITTPHHDIPYDLIVEQNVPIVDTKNTLKQHKKAHIHIV